MLHATILKTHHQFESEARKLVDYVRSAHAFSYESSGTTVQGAFEIEKKWKSILDASHSRSRFKREILPTFGANLDASQKAYVHTLLEYLHRNETPVYIAERFSIEESKRENELYTKGLWMQANGYSLIEAGHRQAGIEKVYGGLVKEVQRQCLIDKNIANNLNSAEEVIRARYGIVADPLSLFIQIGAVHSPEDYVDSQNGSLQVSVLSLADHLRGTNKSKVEMSNVIRNGASLFEMEKFIVADYELMLNSRK